MRNRMFLGLTIAATMPATGSAQTHDITAIPCNGCTDAQFEQAAIGQGEGQRYLYDFSRSLLRTYQVTREPNGRGFSYEAVELPTDVAWQTVFDKADYVIKKGGTLTRSVVLTLPGAPGTNGHANDSVFDLFTSRSGQTTFGNWLGEYFASRNIPVDAPEGTDELQAITLANPTIRFAGNKKRLTVTVHFKDGRAVFELSDDEEYYEYRPGSARDNENHPIPETKEQLEGAGWVFRPGGSAAKGFEDLARYWKIEIGTGGWDCGTAVGGSVSSITCIYRR